MGRAAMNARSLVPRRVTPAAEVKTFGTREKALKTVSFERDGATGRFYGMELTTAVVTIP